MKRIEELTAKEKYEILLIGDAEKHNKGLCYRIYKALWARSKIISSYDSIPKRFDMDQFKPAEPHIYWWELGDPAREEAWKKLIEYWKHEAEKL